MITLATRNPDTLKEMFTSMGFTVQVDGNLIDISGSSNALARPFEASLERLEYFQTVRDFIDNPRKRKTCNKLY